MQQPVSSNHVRVDSVVVDCNVPDDAYVRWKPVLRVITSVKQDAASRGSLLHLYDPDG